MTLRSMTFTPKEMPDVSIELVLHDGAPALKCNVRGGITLHRLTNITQTELPENFESDGCCSDVKFDVCKNGPRLPKVIDDYGGGWDITMGEEIQPT